MPKIVKPMQHARTLKEYMDALPDMPTEELRDLLAQLSKEITRRTNPHTSQEK